MTTPQISLLRTALQARLKTVAGYLGDDSTQWENMEFTPDGTKPYQAVHILTGDPINPEIGGTFIENGYMQVTLRYPINKGAGDAMAMAQAIRNSFYRGLQLAAGAVNVTITNTPTFAPGANDGDRYSLPVKIRFSAINAS